MRRRFQKAPVEFLVLILFLLASALYLRPWALNFPLNDDWSYTLDVRHLLESGRMRLNDWASGTLILQVLWGSLWTKVFGFHMGVLKLSTLFLSALACLTFDSSLKLLGVDRRARLLSVLLLAGNPLFFCLSFSFMTDVPYLCLMLVALNCYLRAERADWASWAFLGSIATAGAFLIRQIGILIPLGYSACLLFQRRLTMKRAALIWCVPVAALATHGAWFDLMHGPTWASEQRLPGSVGLFLSLPQMMTVLIHRLLSSGQLMGLMLCPLAAGLFFPTVYKRDKSHSQTALALLTAYLCVYLVFLAWAGMMPQLANTRLEASGNYMTPLGLGVVNLVGVSSKASGVFLSQGFWMLVTLLSLAASAVLLRAAGLIWASAPHGEKIGLAIFLIPSLLSAAAPMIRVDFYDRYLLPALPACILMLSLGLKRFKFTAAPAFLALLFLIGWSEIGTKDYLAWSEAQWKADLIGVQMGLKPEEITGDFEWESYWTYERNMEVLKRSKPVSAMGQWEWRTLNRPKALVTFSPQRKGCGLLGRQSYSTPLSSDVQYISLLRCDKLDITQ